MIPWEYDEERGRVMARHRLQLADERNDLWPSVEQASGIFHCPRGFDIDPTSATYGQSFQCSYGMNYVTNGPNGRTLPNISSGNGTSLFTWAGD